MVRALLAVLVLGAAGCSMQDSEHDLAYVRSVLSGPLAVGSSKLAVQGYLAQAGRPLEVAPGGSDSCSLKAIATLPVPPANSFVEPASLQVYLCFDISGTLASVEHELYYASHH